MEPGEKIELAVTPDRYTTVRYAGASGDFNPIHIDAEFAREVGLPGRILHGLWIMAQVARAHTEAAGGPEHLKRLSVQFRGMGRMEETITITGSVREVTDGVALVNSNAEQGGSRIIRGAEAVLELAVEVAAEGAGATVDASDATSIGSSPGGELPGAGEPADGGVA
jgi:acyl dehydratase